MFEIGKAAQVAAEMRNYQLTILGISEARWNGSGQTRLSTGELVLYSGQEEDGAPHTHGVAFMLSKTAQKSLIGWEAHGPRVITASFKTRKRRINMNVIQCYAPTNDSTAEVKDNFYDHLQAILQRIPQRDITILMGDLNAKIGSDNTGYEEVMGRQGLGEMNDNGERLTDLCALNNLVIGGSVFPHRRIHKATWVSPDLSTENQIDHVCITRKFRRSLQDVCAKRGADAASDHHLVVARLKLKLKRTWTGEAGRRQKYNTTLFKEQAKREEFKLALSNKFQVLQETLEEGTINERWKTIKEAVTTVCQEVLGPKKINHKEWISADSLKKIQTRKEKKVALNNSRTRAEKARAQEAYREANKDARQNIKRDKKIFIDSLAAEAEEAAQRGNMKDLYDITRKLSGRFGRPERPVKDRQGNSIMGEEGQRKRWREHFEELLNRPSPENPPEITPADADLDIDCSEPTKEEIRTAIKQLKSGKAAGPDNIQAEVLKVDLEKTVDFLYPLFKKIWL